MFIIGDLLIAIGKILDTLLWLYMWTIIISAIMSWFSVDPYNQIVRFIHSVTDPALSPIRRFIGYRLGPVDISPLVVVLIIVFLQSTIVKFFYKFGLKLGGG